MGPRRWSRGRASRASPVSAPSNGFNGATAMEPWKRTPGRHPHRVRLRASMGPRRWSRGRVGVQRMQGASLSVLQWGHGDGAVEETGSHRLTLARYPRFNGATAMEPWKSPKLDSLGRPKIGFNGATAMEPWKSRQERRPGDHGVASMGPRRWSRGRARRSGAEDS